MLALLGFFAGSAAALDGGAALALPSVMRTAGPAEDLCAVDVVLGIGGASTLASIDSLVALALPARTAAV